ncbi:MAG TPA: hypothetical protein VMY99_05525 [Nevskiaceae bacterium]|nr:hypothetical protein [Nevskiaceae bacterium]
MKTLGQRGALNVLLIPFILLFLILMGTGGFGLWAYGSRQDYKNNVDQKVTAAVAAAKQEQQKADAAQYAEAAKSPFDTYIGPSAFGNITIKYPKTWSGYVLDTAKSASNPVDAFFAPNIVPNASSETSVFSLRVQLTQQSYDQVLGQFSAQIKTGGATVAAYSLPKVPSAVGSRVEGQITTKKQGVMIILPLRNMTLKIWTESNDYKADLDNNILPNLTFQP